MPAPASPHRRNASNPKPKILSVDDKPANLIALEAVLGEYDVISVGSGEQALKTLETTEVNVILLDIQMPGMDGFETAARIKRMPNYRNTPIIFITAVFKDDPFIKKGYEAGGIDYFTKPFDPDILRMKVGIYATAHQKEIIMRQREERLRHSEELLQAGHKLAAVLESLPVGVIISDAKGGIVQTNDAVLKIWRSIESAQSDSYGEFLRWWASEGRTIKDTFTLALQEGRSSHNQIIEFTCFDGSPKTILSSTSPLRGLNNSVVGAVAVAQDITEHKRIEAHMEESIHRLVSIGVEFEQNSPKD